MTPFWEWIVGVSTGLTLAALLGLVTLVLKVNRLTLWAFGEYGRDGLQEAFTDFKDLTRERHDALEAVLRQRVHDENAKAHHLHLELEERVREIEKQVAAVGARKR